ncbi:MAG: hypothetical protein HC932_04295 [Thermales bacterium]|nr:hypothetical protein [Thermales bacterium]
MKTNKTIIIVVFLIFSIMIGLILKVQYNKSKSPILFGVHDKSNTFDEVDFVDIRHGFMAWDTDPANDSVKLIEKLGERTSKIMITVEPWPEFDRSENIFQDIVEGYYDYNISAICKQVELSEVPVILRWGHEVDLYKSSRYPWALNRPSEYIKAFRYWVQTCKSLTNNAQFVWSPAGIEGMEDFYPGDEYVDIVGLSVFAYPEYEKFEFGKMLNINDVLNSRYERAASFGKPIYLAEFGVAGEVEYKKEWLENAFNQIYFERNFPRIAGVIYFNHGDEFGWVPEINPPDFRIQPEWIEDYVLAK